MNTSQSMSLKTALGLLFVIVTISIVSAYGTTNPIVFGHSAGELDFTGFAGNINTTGSVTANSLCIGTDCRTSWPTSSSTIINSTIFLNGTLVLNSTSGTVIVLNNTVFSTINNTVFTPNPINLNSISGNVIASGDVQGSRLCIGTDCRTSWPTSTTSNGSPTLIFQAQRFIDDDTNYYIDLNTGANIAGTWNLDGQLKVNSVCIGTDCRTSWPTSSSASVLQTTVGELELNCHPSSDSAHFMNTCGHRYCVAHGYTTGFVVEYQGNAANELADVSCLN